MIQRRAGLGLVATGALTAALLMASQAPAQQLLFQPVAPEKVAFNYPDPPRIGEQDFFIIAENGEAKCVVVARDRKRDLERSAAFGLIRYLSEATGARIRLVADGNSTGGLAAIHVGCTSVGRKTPLDLPDVRYGDVSLPNVNGYLVKTVDRRTLVIRGKTPEATMHGVVGFLERFLGVRQYWQGRCGSIGVVTPKSPTLRLPRIEWRDWPYFYSRNFSKYAFGKRPFLRFCRPQKTLPCNENYGAWLPPAKYAETHPEYYTFGNGKRKISPKSRSNSGWQPCIGNPNVVRIMSEAVEAYFDKHPDLPGVNFAINDGGGDCMCPKCRALDPPDADFGSRVGTSDRYMRLTNAVCKRLERKHPNKLIVFLAYASARRAPKTVRLHPKIVPVLTTPGNFFAAWDAWMKTGAQHMGMYVHHDDDLMFVLPKLDVRQGQRRIRYAVGSGRARVYYAEMYSLWPITGILTYVFSHLTWDPRLDADAMVDEYCETFFGPAAKPMRAFYATLESGYERWLAAEGDPYPYGPDASCTRLARSMEQFKVLNPEEAAKAAGALAEAARLAGAREPYGERIRIVRAMFTVIHKAADAYGLTVRLRKPKLTGEADARRVVEDARRLVALRRETGDYARNVLEKGPLARYRLFIRALKRRPNPTYEILRTGAPTPQDRSAVSAGVRASTDLLRRTLGAKRAEAWWRAELAKAKEPLLKQVFQTALLQARGVKINNLAQDPSFEKLGREFGARDLDMDQEVALTYKQQRRAFFRVWFAERSRYRVLLTRKAAHSGQYGLRFEACHRGRLSRYAKAKPKTRYRAGLWVKRNNARGSYTLVVVARSGRRLKGGGRKETVLATIKVPPGNEDWQQVSADVVTPDQTRLMLIRFFINGQAADATICADDLLIGEYAE